MQAYAPPPRDPTAVMGRRIAAYLIDVVIATLLLFVLFVSMAQSFDKSATEFDGINVCPTVRQNTNRNFCFEGPHTAYTLTNAQAAVVFGLPFLVSLANLVVLQGATGASVGKHILGLRVIDGDGNLANFGRAIVRWLLLIVDGACVIVGLIVASATKPHRRVGDFAAGTFVVGRNDVGYRLDELMSGARPDRAQYAAAVAMPVGSTAPVQPVGAAPAGMPSAPVWDAPRGAWVCYDPRRQGWLRYDDAAREWRPL